VDDKFYYNGIMRAKKRRPDIAIEWGGLKSCHEIQNSEIAIRELNERTNDLFTVFDFVFWWFVGENENSKVLLEWQKQHFGHRTIISPLANVNSHTTYDILTQFPMIYKVGEI